MMKERKRKMVFERKLTRKPIYIHFRTKKEAEKLRKMVNQTIKLNGNCTIAEYYSFANEILPDSVIVAEPRDYEFAFHDKVVNLFHSTKNGYWMLELGVAKLLALK